MKISFLGGAGTVTGSKFLIVNDQDQILVDCGLFQGLKQLRLLNWEQPLVNPSKIKAVILTHAHLDHCGYLPLLVKHGFNGPIYCTAPTQELTKIILLDCAKIQVEDAEYANRKGFSKHHPALPLYNVADVEKCFPLIIPIKLNDKVKTDGFEFQFTSGGHILGATSVFLTDGKIRIFFSGDLGRSQDPLMPSPTAPVSTDYLVMESTYGDRHHSTVTSSDVLKKLINQISINQSVLLIPAFAVGRSQNLLFEIIRLKQAGSIPQDIPIFFNSPMGEEVWQLYGEYFTFQKLTPTEFNDFTKQVHFIKTAEQSKALNEKKGPMIIIAASGMLTGGRVLHHIKAFASNPQNIILLAGFQSQGTRGWKLAVGEKKIKLHGIYLDILAQVISSDSFSAHSDQDELLIWLAQCPTKPKTIFLVHGEPNAADDLRRKIEETMKLKVQVPNLNDSYILNNEATRIKSLQI